MPKLVAIGFMGAASHVGEIYSSRSIIGLFLIFSPAPYYSSCFVNLPADHNSQQILTYDGSKDVICRQDVPFG